MAVPTWYLHANPNIIHLLFLCNSRLLSVVVVRPPVGCRTDKLQNFGRLGELLTLRVEVTSRGGTARFGSVGMAARFDIPAANDYIGITLFDN